GNVAAAIEGWKRVLDLRGEDPEALRALAHLYEAERKWSELTDVLERHFDIAESDDDRIHVLTTRARLFDEQLNRDEEALETYRRVLDIEYSNPVALRAIVNIWRRRKNADELVSALNNLVEAGATQFDAADLAEYYRELAKLYLDQLDQPFEAADAFRKLLDVAPGDLEALDRLETLYRAEEQWADIVDVKMQRAAALPDVAEQVREYLEVTDMWRAQLHEYDKSVTAYDRILELEPLHERAFLELERLHTAVDRWELLIELYLNRLEHYEELAARSDLLRRIARVFDEKLGDQNQAFDALVTAFADDYSDDQTAAYLERMCQATERWGELITSANGWLQAEQDRKRKIQLSLRLGKWYGEDLGRPSDAMAYYQVVLEIDPQNTRVMRQMAAIERLAGNYAKAGQMLNKALEVAVANDDRKAILADLGELLHRNMDQADQAIPYYKRALDVDALYLPALNALEQIYDQRGQVQELVKVLTKKADAIDRPDEAIRQKLRLGDLLENQLKDDEGATKAYREALQINDADLSALKGLERSLTRLEQWTELVQVLERQLEVTEIERDRVALLIRLADVLERQFLKADVAAKRLEQALEIDHTQMAAYEGLARCYRRLKQFNDLISTYRRHIDETNDRAKKLELFMAIGTVYRDELGSLDDAIDAFQEVVDADDTNILALDALSKLFEKQGEAARSIEMMTRVAELTADGGQKVDMFYRIGRAMEEKLSDRFGAREKFELALDLDPGHLPSLTALRTIAVDEADWDAACRYLEQEQARTDAPRQRARLLVELGKIREDMLGEHGGAISAYEEAIRLDSDCEEAAMPLVAEYGEQGQWSNAAPLAEMLVRRSKNRERTEQHALQKQLGMVMFKLGAFDKALAAYQAAHQLDMTDADTVRGVANAAFSLQDWPTALTNYQKVLTSLAEEDVEGRTEVYFRLGEIKKAQGQDRQAINNYEKALALDGDHRPSLQALVSAYEKSG
ncbi:MAG TPA: tetratricopeptide repeat protein, partial [Polyangiaceae bacterium]|nr:tetratricopeptide repeat protein [Polyangiaceae bacterium]